MIDIKLKSVTINYEIQMKLKQKLGSTFKILNPEMPLKCIYCKIRIT